MNIEQRIADLEQRVSILESEATAATAAHPRDISRKVHQHKKSDEVVIDRIKEVINDINNED